MNKELKNRDMDELETLKMLREHTNMKLEKMFKL